MIRPYGKLALYKITENNYKVFLWQDDEDTTLHSGLSMNLTASSPIYFKPEDKTFSFLPKSVLEKHALLRLADTDKVIEGVGRTLRSVDNMHVYLTKQEYEYIKQRLEDDTRSKSKEES